MVNAIDDGAARVFRALEAGELSSEGLSARQVCAFLGYTTGHLYHHFGSLDGLLCGVMQLAFLKLAKHMQSVMSAGAPALAEAFVEFGIEHPSLYALMFERRYDWTSLRTRGLVSGSAPGLVLWNSMVAYLRAAGAREPVEDARVLIAGLHGLVSMALSGRANIGALDRTDREVALSSARRLAHLVCLPGSHATSGASQTDVGERSQKSESKKRRRDR